MSIKITPSQRNLASSYSNKVSFGSTNTIKSNDNEGDSFVSKHKKELAVGAAGLGAVALTAWAYLRGKTVNTGKESSVFSNIKEGFKTFFGEGRQNYLNKLKEQAEAAKVAMEKTGATVDTEKLQNTVNNSTSQAGNVETKIAGNQAQTPDISKLKAEIKAAEDKLETAKNTLNEKIAARKTAEKESEEAKKIFIELEKHEKVAEFIETEKAVEKLSKKQQEFDALCAMARKASTSSDGELLKSFENIKNESRILIQPPAGVENQAPISEELQQILSVPAAFEKDVSLAQNKFQEIFSDPVELERCFPNTAAALKVKEELSQTRDKLSNLAKDEEVIKYIEARKLVQARDEAIKQANIAHLAVLDAKIELAELQKQLPKT